MLYFKKYFILFIISFLLAACGDSDHSGVTASQSLLAPLQATKAASKSVPSTEQKRAVVHLMVSMLNAAPGAVNLDFLAGYLTSGTSILELAKLLEQTDIFKGPLLYPSTLSSQQFAKKFVENFVGDTANYLNKSLLTSEIARALDSGLSRGEAIWLVVSALVQIPVTDPTWGRTAAQFANKTEVAYYYSVTTSQASEDLGTLQAVIRYVTDDLATVATAQGIKPVNLAPSWASASISSGSRQIRLSWTKLSKAGATGSTSTIYWSKNPGVSKKTGAKLVNVTTPYTHTGLTNGTMYYYVITETISGLEGPESLEMAAAPQPVLPPAPTNIAISPLNGAIRVRVDRAGAVAAKFNLYWSKTANFQTPAKITNAFGLSDTFKHTGLTNGTIYYYAVTAEGPEGESSLSRAVAAMPLADSNAVNYQANGSAAKIAAPNAITAVAANQSMTLAWNLPAKQIPTIFSQDTTATQPPAISGYTIYWSTELFTDTSKANKIAVPMDDKASLPLVFTHNNGLANNNSYYYCVTAVADRDVDGNPLKTVDGRLLSFESPASSLIMVTPEAKAPASLTGLSATSGVQQITLNWPASATKDVVYHIYGSDRTPAKSEDLVQPENLVTITSAATYIHSGLQHGITYYYVVTAVAGGESAPTTVVSVALR